MAITIDGTAGTIAGLVAGGLPDGIVDGDMLAANAVSTGKILNATIASSDIASGVIPAGGVTESDQWYQTSEFTAGGSTSFITSNWARSGSPSGPLIGTGMTVTQSNGIFVFPSTGHWLISTSSTFAYLSASSAYSAIHVHFTSDNGNYAEATGGYTPVLSGSVHATHFDQCIVDVTNTSLCKVKFGIYTAQNVTFKGSSRYIFIKLGDT